MFLWITPYISTLVNTMALINAVIHILNVVLHKFVSMALMISLYLYYHVFVLSASTLNCFSRKVETVSGPGSPYPHILTRLYYPLVVLV